jgi:hypothetical protein
MTNKTDRITITTLVQAKYWLEQGEILIFVYQDGMGYINTHEKDKEKVKITLQPSYEKCTVYTNDWSAVDEILLETLKEVRCFYVYKGNKLTFRKLSLIENIVNYIVKRFTKK